MASTPIPTPDSTAPASRHALRPPGVVVVPGYEVRGEIARGNMGRVLAARDLAFGRDVAIKVILRPEATAPAELSQVAGRFVRESRITGRLTHPGIPPTYQLGALDDGLPFLAMKLVRGRTLAALLADRPDPGHDLPRFVAVFEQVCQAVGYAHSQGVIHRDLKPANIMVGAFGEVQVMDWGLAKEVAHGGTDAPRTGAGGAAPDAAPSATGSTVGDDQTGAGAVMGTPAYMAPEQARGEPSDVRADVFALGGVLAAILVARAPFQSSSVASALGRAAAGDTAEVTAALIGCGADGELLSLSIACLAPDRADRPADGTAVADLVAAYRTGVEDRLRSAERDRAAAEARAEEEANTRREAEAKVSEQRKRRRTQAALAASALVLVIGASGVALWRVEENGKKREEVLRSEWEESQRQSAERDRKQRASDAVEVLLDQARPWLEVGDAERAAPFIAQADRRAADDAVADHAERLLGYRTDLAMLRELDALDTFRWTPQGPNLPPRNQMGERRAAAFAKFGMVLGPTPPREVAGRVNRSAAREALVAALDAGLVQAPQDQAEAIRAVLAAADPNPFRDEIRPLIAAGDLAGLTARVERPEWGDQPDGLAQAFVDAIDARPDLVRTSLDRATRRRPDSFGLVIVTGGSYAVDRADTVAERLRWYQTAVGLRPSNPAARQALGRTLFDKGDLAGAMDAYQHAVRLAPEYAPPHSGIGLIHSANKEHLKSVASHRTAVRLEPSAAVPHSNLGAALLHAHGDVDEAIASCQEAVRLDPGYALGFSNLGLALQKKGRLDEAVASCREAIRLDPRETHGHLALGRCLFDRRDTDAAAAAYGEAARLAPGLAVAHHGLALCLRTKGDVTGALAALREAIRADPSLAPAHADLGSALRVTGRVDEAISSCREAIRLDPALAVGHVNLGAALRDKGDLEGAIASHREAIRLDPSSAVAHNNLGVALRDAGELAGAAVAFERSIVLGPRVPQPRVNLAHVYRRQGHLDKAIEACRAALELQPSHPVAREEIDYCLRVRRGDGPPTAPPPRPVRR
ncbi:MAG TPA: tetratricopeptide repeat protein [Urbifossiella sp.]|nr:tetratricopeptide repeat protein [Urbifossiella sp.]